MNPSDPPIRVIVQQPSLAKYRVAVWRELASRDGIDLTILYGDEHGITNVAPEGFRAQFEPLRQWRIGSQQFFWHAAQLRGASPKTTDVLILGWNMRYLSMLPALLKAKFRGVPVILWGHGYSRTEHPAKLAVRRSVTGLATALMFYDSRTAAQIVEAGWPAEKVFVAPNALDQAPIQRARQMWLDDPQRLERFRREHELTDAGLLLYVSRLLPENRLDRLVEALGILEPRFPALQVAIIGGGQQERERLSRIARQRNVESRVRFLGAIYDESQLAPWFLSADAFVYPENIGLSILHAFGYGLPVITSDAIDAQNPEIVALVDGENGLLYEHGSTEALVDRIARLLEDESLRERMRVAARETVLQRFDVGAMVDGMVAAIRYGADRQRA